LKVDLRVGSIEKTSYDNETFDIVTCASSMSYWEDPVACFNEVYRILKSGGTAIFFEPQQGVDVDEVVKTIRANLADASKVRQFAAVSLNKFALRRGDRVGLNLYSKDEILRIANQSRFTEHVSIEKTTLQNLPIFLRIRLTRVA
jgi:ubiquinone/menaquinone biosynthesis C-methylase UbiE